MAALRSLSFCLLAVGLLLPAASTEQRINITAEAGQDSVTLPCGAGKEKKISTVEWSRPDLRPDGVLPFSYGRFESDRQHPSFRNRVDLQDRQMKEGNASLILKDVTMNDIGTYKCVIQSKGDMGFFFETFIYLDVTPPGKAPPTSEAPPTSGAPPPDSSPHHFGLMLLLRLLVFCPYFISTLLLVSVYRLRAKESKQLVSMTTAPPLQAEPGLDGDYDDVTTEHHF